MNNAVQTHGLTKRYGQKLALEDLNLSVPAGTVMGYLGPNGSGKTTTLRLLLGLLHPTSGSATVLGHDTVKDRRGVHMDVGYLPGDFVAPRRLTARTYLRYLASFRDFVGSGVIEAFAGRLQLPLDVKIGALSHGNRQKVGLVQAFMHFPPLLILDEPTSGLDPLVQQEFLTMVREVRDDKRTVLLSSHALSEVDAVADTVAILREGRLVAVEDVEKLRSRALRRVELQFAGEAPLAELSRLPEVRDATGVDGHAVVTVEGSMADFWEVVAPHRIIDVRSHETDLEKIFLDFYTDDPSARRGRRAEPSRP